jgi:allantoin racemase
LRSSRQRHPYFFPGIPGVRDSCVAERAAQFDDTRRQNRVRILVINPNTSSAVTELVTARVRAIAGQRATIIPATGRFGARYISTRAAAAIAGHAALECDAVYLACFGDPGLAALQEVSPVPVVGMAEASCRTACRHGARFAIVTGGASWEPMLREFVFGLGSSKNLAAIRTIPPAGDEIARDPDAALASLAAACTACANEDGADIVILGGAALAGLAALLQPAVPVPVLCSVEVGAHAVLEAAEARSRRLSPMPAVETVGLAPALGKLLGSA